MKQRLLVSFLCLFSSFSEAQGLMDLSQIRIKLQSVETQAKKKGVASLKEIYHSLLRARVAQPSAGITEIPAQLSPALRRDYTELIRTLGPVLAVMCSCELTAQDRVVLEASAYLTSNQSDGLGTSLGVNWKSLESNWMEADRSFSKQGGVSAHMRGVISSLQSKGSSPTVALVLQQISEREQRWQVQQIFSSTVLARSWACSQKKTAEVATPDASRAPASLAPTVEDVPFTRQPLASVVPGVPSSRIEGKKTVSLATQFPGVVWKQTGQRPVYHAPRGFESGTFAQAHEIIFRLYGEQQASVLLNFAEKAKQLGHDVNQITSSVMESFVAQSQRGEGFVYPSVLSKQIPENLQSDFQLLLRRFR